MMKSMCSMCVKPFTPAPGIPSAFCGPCIAKINADALEAESYESRIKNGDINVVPINAADAKRVRQAIRKRLDPKTRDTQYPKRTKT